MKLARAINIGDLRALARRRLPRMVFDYIDGGAEDEITLQRNRSAFDRYELLWRALRDVREIDTGVEVMGASARLPFLISPTAATRLFHPRSGERAVARAAGRAGMIYSISTLGSVSIEDIANETDGPKWFQVYVWKDRELTRAILERVRAAGFTGLVLTVDVPVAGKRERDHYNGFTVPPKISARTVSQVLQRPLYLWDVATSPRIGPANFPDPGVEGGVMAFIDQQFDASVTWDYAKWLKTAWGGPMAIKGISTPADAELCLDAGADAVWVSNHGGRQVDTAPATIDVLPDIVSVVAGKADVILDGGIRRGSHIVKALALGADAVAIGRPYLYGVAAAGEAGVARAIDILEDELRRTMALLGITRIADLGVDVIRR